MSQTATRSKKTTPAPPARQEAPPRVGPHRDTVESLAVAFILALLIRGFEAEAFVIPTGSMAPTLMGRHKEITCPQCGNVYTVNASDETELGPDSDAPSRWEERGTCVNCRFQTRIDQTPSFKGDRILVMKFLYDLPHLPGASRPERWDVVVFKYPEDPETNYIKRLIGLPEEEVRIHHGDILTRPRNSLPDEPFHLERKPLRHQRAMQILVYDDAHRAEKLKDDPRWLRWQPTEPQAWKEPAPGRFTAAPGAGAGAGQQWSELRYSHLVPDPTQWDAIEGRQELPRPPRPTLITDFYSYNTNVRTAGLGYEGSTMEPHWVGDLTVSLELKVESASGRVRFELVEGGVPNRCEVDLATGEAVMTHGETTLGRAQTVLKGPGTFDVAFANVDDRLTLWVDGGTPFGEGLEYGADSTDLAPAPTAADLSPVAVSAKGASVQVSGLVLKRDIYYTLEPGLADYDVPWDRYASDPVERTTKFFDLLASPAQYAALPMHQPREYPIGPGRYMMMGDNSPRSKDGRGWTRRDAEWDPSGRESWEVPEALLIGKAFFVYWPHGKPFGPTVGFNRDFRFPFRPYFERMKWIR